MSNQDKGLFSGLPKWAKGVIAVGVLVSVGIVSYKIYKSFGDLRDRGDEKDVLKDADKEIKALQNSGMKLSFPKSTYESSANSIKQQLNGCETPFTEVKAANEVIRVCNNQLDWLELVKAFGIRKIEQCAFGSDINYTLPTLLKEQLDSMSPLGGTIYTNMVAALRKKGIKI